MKLKLMEGKALAKLIGQIGTARVQLDGQVQHACLQVIGQSIVHRNTTPANALLEAVSKHHTSTLVAYLEKFGNFEWNRKESKLAFREVFKAEQVDEAIDAIGEAKWYDAKKPAKVVSQYDAVEVISGQIEKLLKAKQKGVEVKNLRVLEAVIAAYHKAVGEMYEEGDQSVEELAIKSALEARQLGQATPHQLETLTKYFSRNVEQVKLPDNSFGGEPKAVNQ